MRIRVLGGGYYGCHISLALLRRGYTVELHECAGELFAGASGANPARLHLGFHYPRSRLTRAACQDHQAMFRATYGHLTRAVPVNIYAVAAHDSLLDWGTYRQVLAGELQFIEVDPGEFGLRECEGAMLTGERHVIIQRAREFFGANLGAAVRFMQPLNGGGAGFDWTIDCTFCANDAEAVDRFEPCVTGLLTGPVDRAVTIMDGPFPSIYPWDPDKLISSISSASLTPLSKDCRTYGEARTMIDRASPDELWARVEAMVSQMVRFWPAARGRYAVLGYRTAIRAMPRSAADARLVDVVRTGERTLRVRAGKIDAIFAAERIVVEQITGATFGGSDR